VEDWPISILSLNYWLRVRKARGRDKRGGRRRLREGKTALYTLISISSILEAYINIIADISSK
jgi:hypothetical protein